MWWCGGVFVVAWWCFCEGFFVVLLLCFCCGVFGVVSCGGVFVVVCLWCFCGGVFLVCFVVLFLWCLCGGVLVVFLWCFCNVLLWWCFCGGVVVILWFVVVFYEVLLRTTKDRFVRGFFQISQNERPKRAFRAILPTILTAKASKMIISCEASSKFHRTVLPKRAFRVMLL